MVNDFYKEGDLARLGKPIWERLFLTSMCYKDTLSVDEIRIFGMPTVGDKAIDADMHNQRVERYLTINQMVDYFKEGIPVCVRIHSETKDIYDIISNYLLCWKQQLQNGINIGGAPIDDLVALDRFACVVYDHAVEHITDDFIQSSMSKYFGNRMVGRAAFDAPAANTDNGIVKQRESMAGLFSERVFLSRGRTWR